jgi:hypothetical protein
VSCHSFKKHERNIIKAQNTLQASSIKGWVRLIFVEKRMGKEEAFKGKQKGRAVLTQSNVTIKASMRPGGERGIICPTWVKCSKLEDPEFPEFVPYYL